MGNLRKKGYVFLINLNQAIENKQNSRKARKGNITTANGRNTNTK